MKKLTLFLLTLAFLSVSAQAGTVFRNRFSIGGGGGASWPEQPDAFRKGYDDAQPVWTGYLGYGLTQDALLRLSYTNMQFDRKGSRGSSVGDVTLQPILLSLKLHFIHDAVVSPYVLIGAGISNNEIKGFDGPGGRVGKQTWTDFAAQGGAGLEFFVGKYFSIAAEGRYDYVEPKNKAAAFQAVSALGLLNFYFNTEDRTAEKKEAAAAPPAAAAAPATQTVVIKNDQDQERIAAQQAAAVAAANAARAAADADARMKALEQRIATKEVSPITFDTGSDHLVASSSATLNQVASIAKEYPTLKLDVEGHTDNVGTPEHNQELSQKRAEAVRTYLIEQGVEADRISATGFGQTRPVASNTSASGRDQNRRVEFKFQS